MHGRKQPQTWHRRPSLRAVLPAKHGMLWGKQPGKQETVLAQKNPAPAFLPSHPLSCFPWLTCSSLLQFHGNYHHMGGKLIGDDMRGECCVCSSKIQSMLLTPNYTPQMRKVSSFVADTSLRKNRKGEWKGGKKARREEGSPDWQGRSGEDG